MEAAGQRLADHSTGSASAGDPRVHYSRGASKVDAFPEQRSAASFEAFAEAVLADRSRAKGQAWIAAPFKPNSDGRHHRCAAGVLPRWFLAIDQDGGTRQGLVELGMYLVRYRGFGYTTASHTTGNPHSRHVLETSRPVDRSEGIRLGETLQRQIEAHVGSRALRLDPSVYRGEQPFYAPLLGASVMRYNGDAIDIDDLLKDAPPLKEGPGRMERAAAIASSDPIVRALADHGMVKRDHGDGKLSVVCPCGGEHTGPSGESSTVYFLPNFGGVAYGKFVCMHEHCAKREQEDFIRALEIDPRDVWREQRGDDLPPLGSYAGDAAREDARERAGGGETRSGNGPGIPTPPGGERQPTPFLTANMLWNMQHDPTHWAVPAILPEGVALFCGKPKIGKSWLALDLALAVGTGGRALGAIEVEPGPVLFLALEDTKRRLTKRLRILCGNTKPPPEQIEFLTDCPRLGSGGEEVLQEWLHDHPTARLVVIDTLARFRPATNAKETLYHNDYLVGQCLSRLCVEHQVSILVLGHTRKQPSDDAIDEISGTLGLVGSVDGYMVLRRQAMSDEATMSVGGRDVDEPAEHCLSWDRPRARWGLTGGDPRVSRLPTEQRRAYELLSKAPKNAKELTEALNPGHVVTDPASDTRRRAAEAIAHKLLEKGLIARRPFDRRWSPIHTTTTSSTRESGDGVVPGNSGRGGSSSLGRTCPSCAGEGCDWCGGMGRLVDDQQP